MQNNECGRAAYPSRAPPAPVEKPSIPDSVAATGFGTGRAKHPYNYRFPLDRCLGLKNDGGAGHYGASRIGGRTHNGCDYYAPRGTEIKAPCDGRVVFSDTLGKAGNYVRIRCNDGSIFKFMHLHSRPPKARYGKRVSTGEVIGGVGNTGNARKQATHLHLEVYYRGRRQDPQKVWDCGGDSGH